MGSRLVPTGVKVYIYLCLNATIGIMRGLWIIVCFYLNCNEIIHYCGCLFSSCLEQVEISIYKSFIHHFYLPSYSVTVGIKGVSIIYGTRGGYEKIGKGHETEGPYLGRTMKQ